MDGGIRTRQLQSTIKPKLRAHLESNICSVPRLYLRELMLSLDGPFIRRNNVNSRQSEVTITLWGSGLTWHIKRTTVFKKCSAVSSVHHCMYSTKCLDPRNVNLYLSENFLIQPVAAISKFWYSAPRHCTAWRMVTKISDKPAATTF